MEKFTNSKKTINTITRWLICAVLLVGFTTSRLSAQCTNASAYGSATAPTNATVVTISTASYQSEYTTVSGIVAGNKYIYTNSAAASYITIHATTSNGPVVAFGKTPLVFTAPIAGTYYCHSNTNATCGTASVNTTTAIGCVTCGAVGTGGCTNASAYGSATAPTSVAPGPVTISTASYQSEYTTISGIAALTTYKYTNSTATSWITIHSGSSNGPIVASGGTPLIFTSTVAGTYYCHSNTNVSCGTASANTTTTITWISGAFASSLSATALAPLTGACPGATVGPNSFTITGTSLSTANVTVGALANFSYSTTAGGTYTSTLSLAQAGGAYSQAIFVKFTAPGAGTFTGNIPVGGGGAATINVAASGTGVNTPVALTLGSVNPNSNGAVITGTYTQGCSSVISYGVERSTTNGFANGTGTFTAGTGGPANYTTTITGLTPSTVYYYHLKAQDGAGISYSTQGTFTTLSISPILQVSIPPAAFGNVCSGSTAGPNSFILTGSNLTAASVTLAALSGFSYSLTSNGTYTSSLTFTPGAGTTNTTIFVKFSPVAVQSYTGNIVISGGGAPNINVVATGSGLLSPAAPSVNTPAGICLGQSANLNATSAGNSINWYNASTGGILLGTVASAANFSVTPAGTTTYWAETQSGTQAGSQTFSYSGSIVNFTVPAGVNSITIDAYGAQGGAGIGGAGGLGARMQGTVSVNGGDILKILVGGQGGSGNQGGGGGGSFVTTNANAALVVAGGGGGGYYSGGAYSAANSNGSTATAGNAGIYANLSTTGGVGGAAGSGGGCAPAYVGQSEGAGGGGLTGNGSDCIAASTGGRSFTNGGAGGISVGAGNGGFGGGGAGEWSSWTGGGGGGGYSGGGGGTYYGVGGGGGSIINGSTLLAQGGVRSGNGQVIISWPNVVGCTSLTRTSSAVTVNGPVISNPGPQTAAANNSCQAVVNYTATTTQGSLSYVFTGATTGSGSGNGSGSTFNRGVTTVALSATFGGCTANISFTVTVNDVTAPVVNVPANITVVADNATCNGKVVAYTAPTTTDNCGFLVVGSQTFNYTGSIGTFTVPNGVTSINITAKGAQGGSNGGTGGLGAIMTGTFTVTPGQVLSYLVGQQPPNNYSFAAGGGGTFVGLGASNTTATPMIVAGGGGGSVSGLGGNASLTTSGNGPAPGTNGNGAPTTSCGGGAGGYYTSGGNDNLTSPSFIATGGAGFQQGGAGGSGGTNYSTGGFGGGASPNYYGSCNMEAGAGGGYSGGSGMNSGGLAYVGYGGGSYNGGTAQSNSIGNTGNGQIVITWNGLTPSIAPTQSAGLASGVNYPLGTTTNTFTATDAAGNVTSQSFTVTVATQTAFNVTQTGSTCTAAANFVVNLSGSQSGVNYDLYKDGILVGGSTVAGTGGAITFGTQTVAGVYTVKATSGACITTMSGNVTLFATPVVTTPSSAGSCNNVLSNIVLTTNPSGAATFSWPAPVMTGVTGGTSGSGSTIANTLVGLGGTAVYSVTPVLNGCTGSVYPITVTVSTPPTITTAAAQPACAGQVANIPLASSPAGATYTWTLGTISGVSGASACATSCNSTIGQTLTGANGSTVQYNVTPYFGASCPGTVKTITVTLQAAPVATATPSSQALCSGIPTNIALTGGTTYSWTVSQISGGTITGFTPSSGSTIAQTLTNNSGSSGVVRYVVTPASAVCPGNPVNVDVTVSSAPLPPSGVSSNPSSLCTGGTANLSAISTGNTINWYSQSVGGTLYGSSASAANFPVTPTVNTTYYVEANNGGSGSQTINYTGSIVNFTVPATVTSLNITAKGASGGFTSGSTAGNGATMQGTFAVTPGQVLSILVGQSPGLTTLYPAGGGGTFVADGASFATANPLIVAGGGGGAYSGATGTGAPFTTSGTGTNPGTGGNGAPAMSCVGGGGGFYTSGGNDVLYGFFGGAGFRQGGAGGAPAALYAASYQTGGFGGGTAANYVGSCNQQAGSGGGYSGGSGWGVAVNTIGNAGGSYNGGTSQVNTAGNNAGNGQVVITWNVLGCASTRVPLTVNVNTYPAITVQPVTPAPICGAGIATLSVTATNATTYQWYKGVTPLTNTAPYSGVNTSTLTITNPSAAENNASLTCVVGNGTTCTVTSTARILTVNTVPAAPSPVTATPTSVCANGAANLNATSAGSSIFWYNAATNGTLLGTSASAANFGVTPAVTTTYYAEANNGAVGSQTFNYTGSISTFTVPVGVSTVTILAKGAQGGSVTTTCPHTGGLGASMQGTFAVTPGQILSVLVGQQGLTNGSEGGGGGGSFVVASGNTPLIIAGGGGGASNNIATCGAGQLDGLNASITTSGTASGNGLVAGGTAGNGGTNVTGSGSGGAGFLTNGSGGSANPLAYVNGGTGANNGTSIGGFGGGGCGWSTGGQGGGGGGYSGGSTSGTQPYTGGGGGGSYNSGTNQVNTAGAQTGNGQVVISWNISGCASTTRPPVTVTVNTPVITVQPVSPAPVCVSNGTRTISVTATGTVTGYQWRKNGTNLSNVAPYSGATSATLTITNPGLSESGAIYDVVVSNGACSVTSTATTAFSILPTPAAAVVANSGSMCANGTATLTASGLAPAGGGVTLNGTTDYLLTPNLPNAAIANTTLEIWFKAVGPGVIVSEQGNLPVNSGWHDSQIEVLASGQVMVRVWSMTALQIGTVSFGTWNHVVIRYNGGTLDGLLNGVPSGTSTAGGPRQNPNTGLLYYAIGSNDGTNMGSGAYFNGQVDEFRVWNSALTNADIQSWMNREVTASHPNFSNLVAYYKMNSSNILADSKTGAFPLTSVGAPVSTTSNYYTYTWSGSNAPAPSVNETQTTGIITPPQNYTVTANVAGSCAGAPSSTTTIPVATLSTGTTNASSNIALSCTPFPTVTLTASGGTPGVGAVIKWYNGGCGTGNGGTLVGTGSPLTLSGLNGPAATTTYYANYENCAGFNTCGTGATVTISAPSANAISQPYTDNTTGTGITVNWIQGNGTAGEIVVARLTSTTAVDPIGGLTYSASSVFGAGSNLGGGNFVVYDGYNNTVNVTGLTQLTSYTFTIYDYNSITNCYYIPGASSSVTTIATPCVGTPSPGTTLASLASVCPASSLTLSLSTPPVGGGLTYQWQSSPTNSNFVNISGATSATYVTTQSVATYYQCLVTCQGNVGTSTPTQVVMNNVQTCYCTSNLYVTFGCTDNDVIGQVQIPGTTLNNVSGLGCPAGVSGYNDYTNFGALGANFTCTLQASTSYTVNVSTSSFSENYAAWIDYNDDGSFSSAERIGYSLTTVPANSTVGFPVTLACNPPVGQHRLRVRCIFGLANGSTIDPCATTTFGEVEDYLVTIAAPTSCPIPTALAVTSPGQFDAVVNWAAGCTETSWDVEFGAVGHTAGTGTILTTSSNVNYVLTGLPCNSTREVYVRSNCAAFTHGSWVGPVSVTTTACPGAPTVTNISPTSACSNTTVIITGTNFINATSVKFGGTNAASYVVNSATQITAVVGTGTSGVITVVTGSGTGTGSQTFIFSGSGPTVTANPGNLTANTNSNSCDATVTYTCTFSAGTVTYALTGATIASGNGTGSGSVFNNGVTTVTVTSVTGVCSTQAVFTVTVNDATAPTISGCPSTINAFPTNTNCNFSTVTFATPTVSDNCVSTGGGSQTFNYTGGIVNFTVPPGVNSVNITAIGANGGITTGFTPAGGKGAKMQGDIAVTPGQVLKVLVGGVGADGATSSGGGGGGGSFVTTSTNTPLIVAGGGGGIAVSTNAYTPVGADAVTTTSGVNGYSGLGGTPANYGLGGINGNGATTFSGGGGACGGNGGGLLSNGQANASCCPNTYGYGFVNGATGGIVCTATGNGGFGGGGGGGNTAGGGGGGYSGGGASWNNPTNGGGGGSYNSGTNQNNVAGFNPSGNGQVVITWNLTFPTIVQTTGLPSGSSFPVGTTTNTFIASDASGNTSTCSFFVVVSPSPTAFSITTSGSDCSAAGNFSLGLNGSQSGLTYDLYLDGVATGASLPGTGSPISFGVQSAPGVYTVKTTSGSCTVTMNGSATLKPTPVMTTPSAVGACNNATSNILLTTAPANSTFTWTIGTVTGTSTGYSACAGSCGSAIQQLLGGAGTIQYIVTPTLNNCVGSPYTITVTSPVIPNVATTSPQQACSGQVSNIALTSTPAGATYQWTASLASGTTTGFSNSSLANVTSIAQTLTGTGVVNYVVTPYFGAGCSGPSATIAVNVNTVPSVTISPSAPTAFCGGNTTAINLSSTPSGASFTWTTQLLTSAGSVVGYSNCSSSCGTSIAQTLNNPTAANGTVRYKVTPSLNGCSPLTATNVNQTVLPGALTPTSVTALPTTICSGTSANLNATSSTGSTIKWWTQQTGGTLVGSSATGANFSVSPTTTTTYWAEANTATCPNPTRVSVTVNVNPSPSISLITAPSNGQFCSPGSSASFNVTGSGGTGTLNYSWLPTSGLTPTFGQAVTATPSSATTYTATVTDANSCTATATKLITPLPGVTINSITATPATLCATGNSSIALSVTGAATLGYSWSPTTFLGGTSTLQNPTVTGISSTTTYTVTTTTSSNGCTNTGTVAVNVNSTPPSISSFNAGCPGAPVQINGTNLGTTTSVTIGGLATTGLTIISNSIITVVPNASVSGNNVAVSLNTTCGSTSNNTLSFIAIPTINVSPSLSQTICSGASMTPFVLTSTPSGATFSWTRTSPSGITTTAAASGTATTISGNFTTSNGTSTAVPFTINASNGGCPATPVTATVTLSPFLSGVTASSNPPAICAGGTINLLASVSTLSPTLLDPTTNGGFEGGTVGLAASGWSEAQGAVNRQWGVNTAPGVQGGTYAAYEGSETNNNYNGNNTANSVGHFYRDVVVPADYTNVNLSFYYKMPTVDPNNDIFYVYTTTPSNTPVYNTTATLPGGGFTQVYTNTSTAIANYTLQSIPLSGVAGTTVRIVFTFKSNGVTPFANPAVDNVSVTGTPPVATYAWTGPNSFSSSLQNPTGVTPPNLPVNTYSVTATSAGACAVQTVTVAGATPVTCGALTIGGVSTCLGVQTVTAHPTGGNTPYTYVWTQDGLAFGGNTATINSGLGTHTYACSITDACGTNCSSSTSPITTANAPVAVITSPNNTTFCSGVGAPLDATTTGSPTYQWKLGASNIGGATSSTFSPSSTGAYSVIVTEFGCSVTSPQITISTVAAGITLNYVTATPASICNNTSSVLAAGVAAAPVYTTPVSSNGGSTGHEITNFTGLGFAYTNGTPTVSPGYLNRTTTVGTFAANSATSVSVQSNINDSYKVWIDMNDNGSFEDASELLCTSSVGVNPLVTALTIPASCPNGNHRLRIRNTDITANAIAGVSSISAITSGVTIDFTITVTGGVAPAVTYSWLPVTFLGGVTTGPSVTGSNITSPTTYTVTATASSGCHASGTVPVTIKPIATNGTTATTASICTGATTSVALNSSIPGGTWSWVAADNTNVTGESTSNQTLGTITNTLALNTGVITNQDVVYTVTPISPSPDVCAGTPFTVTVTVKPKPTVTNVTPMATVCSGSAISVPLTANIASTFTWVAANNANTTGESLITQNSSTLNNTVTSNNGVTTQQTITYTVTPTSNGCTGAALTRTVLVNPRPGLNVSDITYCPGDAPVTLLNASAPGTTYTWTASSSSPSLTGWSACTSGCGNQINTTNQPLVNNGSTDATVTYIITPVSTIGLLGCAGAPITHHATLGITPADPVVSPTAVVCSGTNANISITAAGNPDFNWTVDPNYSTNVNGPLDCAGACGNAITDFLTNSGTTDEVVIYTVGSNSTEPSACPSLSTVDVAVTIPRNFTINASAAANGTISPSGANNGVCHGTDAPYAINANSNYHIDDLSVDGVTVNAAIGLSSYTYTFINVSADHTINATFALNCTMPVITPPSPITVGNDLHVCGAIVNYSASIAGIPSPSVTYSENSGTFFSLGITTVTISATNLCGTVTSDFDITINDTEAPVITVPAQNMTVQSDGAGNVNEFYDWLITNWADADATDNCTDALHLDNYWVNDYNSANWINQCGTTGRSGLVGFQVYDQAGNYSNSTYAEFKIIDNIAPVITVPPAIVIQENTGNGTSTEPIGTATGTDIGSAVTITYDPQGPYPVGTTTVTWTATDACGNASTGTQVVTVSDTQDPIITCSLSQTQSANLGQCSSYVTVFPPAFSDNSPGASISNDYNFTADASDVYPVGTTTIIWTVTDGSGNSVTCHQDVVITDDELPLITCAPEQDETADLSQCTTFVTVVQPTFSDNCTGSTISNDYNNSPDASDTYPVGTTTVIWTVTDGHGNSATCHQDIVVTDDELPIITCAPEQTHTADLHQCTGFITVTPPSFTDNCSGSTLTNDYNNSTDASGIYPVGTTTVIWTAIDDHGNSATCHQDIVITDDELPLITCAPEQFQTADLNQCSSFVIVIPPSIADNCTGSTISNDYNNTADASDVYPVGTTTIIWTVEDGNGNSATCHQDITVTDDELPTIVCPSEQFQTAELDMCEAFVSISTPQTADNCTGLTITNDYNNTNDASDIYPVGTTTLTWTVLDGYGNSSTCHQDITVTDDQLPMIVCAVAQTQVNDPGQSSAFVSVVTPTFSDNCTAVTIANSYNGTNDATDVYPVGTTTIEWTVTDVHGNTTTCHQDISVTDGEMPTIACDGTITLSADAGLCETAVVVTTPVFGDNSPGVYIVNNITGTDDASGIYPVGITTIEWTVTDFDGNTVSCHQDVQVTDDEFPSITCSGSQTQTADAGTNTAAVTVTAPIFGDNCTGATITNDYTNTNDASGNYPVGTTTVNWEVTDANGNTSTCHQDITVTDDESPTITCSGSQGQTADVGACNAVVSVTTPVFGDNVAGATVINDYTNTDDASGTYPVGTTTVNWTVTDVAGNTSTCHQDITVTDDELPLVSAPASITVCGGAATVVVLGTPSGSDNCGTVTYSSDAPATFGVGTTVVTWTAEDANGNTATATQNVTVLPYFNMVASAGANGSITPNGTTATCSGTSQIYVITANPGFHILDVLVDGVSNSGAIASGTYTFTNVTTTHTISATFESNCTVPLFTNCPATINANTATGLCSSVVTYSSATSGTTPTITYVLSGATTGSGSGNASGTAFNRGTTTVSLTATNGCGVASCSFNITVNDAELPTITAPTAVTVCNGLPVVLGTPVANDNCTYTVTNNHPSSTYPVGTTVVTWTVTDGSGNTATATQNVTVTPTPVVTATGPGTGVICNGANVQLSLNSTVSGSTFTWTSLVTAGGVLGSTNCASNCGTTIQDVLSNSGNVYGVVQYTIVANGGGCTSAPLVVNTTVGAIPATPVISGLSVVCGLSSATYSVAAVPLATNYTWALSAGSTGMTLSGIGQGTTSITVTFSGTVSGNVTCTASNNCGNSGTASIGVSKSPATPTPVQGPASLCGMIGTQVTYSTTTTVGAAANGANGAYTWTVPAGMTIVSGQGTTSIVAQYNTSFVSGTVKVTANNACSFPGPAATLAVTGAAPASPPASISGPANVCGMTTATYSAPPVAGATSYLWSITGAGTITGSNTGTSVTVNLSGTTAGSISVYAVNSCGNSPTARTLNLIITSTAPGTITGPANTCGMTTATYSVTAVANHTYTWTLATGQSFINGSQQGNSTIIVNIAPSVGVTTATSLLKVTASNGCTTTAASQKTITRCLDPNAMNNEVESSATFTDIYPNPATSEFTIDVTSEKDMDVVVEVYDVLGNIVIHERHQVLSGTTTMKTNIEQYRDGMYFVRLLDVDSNVIHSQTVIKQ